MTIRSVILETIRLSLADISMGQAAPDDYPLSFSGVVLGALPRMSSTQRHVAGVQATNESKSQGSGFVTSFLEVTIDFRSQIGSTEDPATVLENMIGTLQRRVLKDPTLNGLAIDTAETGNFSDIPDDRARGVEGAVIFTVHYRHDLQDPRTYLGALPAEPEAT